MNTLGARELSGPFLSSQISHADIADFADATVNLKREDAEEYREQVRRLRENLDKYAADHPEYGLIKTLLSGSLAKGTALKTLNDSVRQRLPRADGRPLGEWAAPLCCSWEAPF